MFACLFELCLMFSDLICHSFWNVIVHYFFKYFFCLLFLFLFIDSKYAYVRVLDTTGMLCSACFFPLLFSLPFSLGDFYLSIFKLSNSFPAALSLLMIPQSILHLYYVFLLFLVFMFDSFLYL